MRATTSRRLTQGLTAAALVSLVAAGSAAGRVHRVRAGETLEGLSRRYGVPVATLARANGIPDPDRIVAGRRLVVPDPAADGMRQVVTK
ncbi:MAG TPA: LysM domain-containing protein, partial [Acidimicrobiia bacterium]|nr:LysM domain-containing protein [Acidimicrobiia bacterium]